VLAAWCLALAGLLAVVGPALGDTAPLLPAVGLPWSDPAHQTPLELLAGRIASRIAGRAVTVRCEGDGDWAELMRRRGGDPSAEQGFVGSKWNGATGQLLEVASTIELSGAAVCLPLAEFAAAASKPTKCMVVRVASVRGEQRAAVARRPAGRTKRQTRRVLVQRPCYLGGGRTAASMPPPFWSAYERYATAIQALAHESVHASGVVGGQLPSGLPVGDRQAEAKAECFGMQWIGYLASELGDTPDDGRAIASYVWDMIYPRFRTSNPEYWSADCRPGGALDVRTPGSTAWPS
jgi:hypothetical protein